ncbi:MAG: YdeI/OmpD-associated family protein [Taibaiella sp.]|nr:YdeI/OmpD-associated family protein [Taibaiella sp.]
MKKDIPAFYPETLTAWRKWLDKNHEKEQAVWLVFHAKKSGRKTITWSEAVDVALCYGWIDSKKIKVDEHTAHQFFSKRKAKSTWSKINKEKVERLIDAGLMRPAGYSIIEIAKQNGSWTILDDIEALIIPPDLEATLRQQQGAWDAFQGWSKSVKKMALHRIKMARQAETRTKRINEVVVQAGQGKKPKQF